MPLVSVIVPMYGVEADLSDCLRSLQVQTLRDVEFVLVDDNSPDAVPDIARGVAEADSRFVYVHQQNRGPGPGGGRNGGLPFAHGKYVVFVDGDDVLVATALEQLVTAAETTEADLVTCNTVRLVGGSIQRSEFHDQSHPRTLARTNASQSPWLMLDPTPWNKMFRREYFDRVVGKWPERILYEDIVAMTTAHLHSTSTAVLPDDLYLWRVRADGRSITQASKSIAGDLEHLRELRAGAELVSEVGGPELLAWFSWKAFCFDLHWMTRKLSSLDAPSAIALARDMQATAQQLDYDVLSSLPRPSRAAYDTLLNAKPERFRRKSRWYQGNSAVSRSLGVARTHLDPSATLLSWETTDEQTAAIRISVERPVSDGEWTIEVASTSAVAPLAEPPLWTAVGSRPTSLRPREGIVCFALDATTLPTPDSNTIWRLAVRGPEGELGEIGRSLQDRIRSRISLDRALETPVSTLVPFFDNNRLMIALNRHGCSVTSAYMTPDLLTFRMPRQLGDELCSLGLYANNLHEPLAFTRHGPSEWKVPTRAVRNTLALGHQFLFLAGRLVQSPAVPFPVRGALSVCQVLGDRSEAIEVAVASYGQVLVRNPQTLVGELRGALSKLLLTQHIPGL